MNPVPIIFSLMLLLIMISPPLSFAEDEELGEKEGKAGETKSQFFSQG